MRLRRFLRAGALLLAALVGTLGYLIFSNSGAQALPARAEGTLRLASYNVHYIILGQETGPWSVGDWERRKRPMDAAFKALDADLVAFQEMESFAGGNDGGVNLTLDWLLAQNPDYAAAAVGDWRSFPSTQPILYHRDRLVPLEQGWFFFSDTPDVIYSRTFNGSFPAFATWVRFRDLRSGEEFRVYNVHFEYSSRSNRLLSAELVAQRMAPALAAGETVFLVGDLNARHGSETMAILEAAGLGFAPVRGATYHFNRGVNLFGAIDHIAASAGPRLAAPPVVVRSRWGGEWPSDHYPVVADYFLP